MNQHENNSDADQDLHWKCFQRSLSVMCLCPKGFSSRYSRDRHLSKFYESEESDMNSDENSHYARMMKTTTMKFPVVPFNNVKNSSDMTDINQVEMEHKSDNDDTNPFKDLVCIGYEHHLEETRALSCSFLKKSIMTEEEAKQQADFVVTKIEEDLEVSFHELYYWNE